MTRLLCAGCIALLAASCASRMPLLVREDFARADGSDWEPTDPDAWRVGDEGVYELHRQSRYSPPVRSPRNISLLKDVEVTDFTLEVRVQSTTRDYAHRDLCLFFGYQDPSHFYYVHLGKRADANANSIFVVDGAPRVSIAATRTDGTDWDDSWHRVRLVRTVDSGTIEVYFDAMEMPVMTAQDRRFAWGRVGLGSFDDTGRFDDFVLRGSRRK